MNEGIPRLLDLWDKHKIKVTSHMVGRAVELPIEYLAVETTIRHQMTPEHIALTKDFYLPSHLKRRPDQRPPEETDNSHARSS